MQVPGQKSVYCQYTIRENRNTAYHETIPRCNDFVVQVRARPVLLPPPLQHRQTPLEHALDLINRDAKHLSRLFACTRQVQHVLRLPSTHEQNRRRKERLPGASARHAGHAGDHNSPPPQPHMPNETRPPPSSLPLLLPPPHQLEGPLRSQRPSTYKTRPRASSHYHASATSPRLPR